MLVESLPIYLGKNKGDDLFDMLDTIKQNAHLKELMPGLAAKVFCTYNASITLDSMVRPNIAFFMTVVIGCLIIYLLSFDL